MVALVYLPPCICCPVSHIYDRRERLDIGQRIFAYARQKTTPLFRASHYRLSCPAHRGFPPDHLAAPMLDSGDRGKPLIRSIVSMLTSQSFLCTLIVFYDVFLGRKLRPAPPSLDPENLWLGVTDDIKDWLKQAPITLTASVILISTGTYLAIDQKMHSTYFCSSVMDSRSWVLSMQIIGLFLDATIAILLWRVLAWSKTTRSRLRTLATIQWTSACVVWVIYLLLRIQLLGTADEPLYSQGFMGLGGLYIFDMISDSSTLAVLVVSTSLIISEVGPLKPTGVVTFASGVIAAYFNVANIQEWHGTANIMAIIPYHLLLPGFGLFLYTANIRSILFIRRVFIIIIMFGVLVGMSVYTTITPQTRNSHPLDDFIFRARVETDRWLRGASVSDTLRVAVDEYKERNDGTEPPPNFDKWFEFAKLKETPIIDHYEQIKTDIAPFWNMKPSVIRDMSTKVMTQEGEIAFITIVGHKVSHNYRWDNENTRTLDQLVEMIRGFAEHLSDMELPINLSDEPRALPSWASLHHAQNTGLMGKPHLLSSREENSEAQKDSKVETPTESHEDSTPPAFAIGGTRGLPSLAFQAMEAQTCPAGSPGRITRHWNARDFCASCTSRYTLGPFIRRGEKYLNRCDQPDITRLHSFHMTGKTYTPFQQVVPIFSKHKAAGFSDVLIPWPLASDDKVPSNLDFTTRINKLHWRGKLGSGPLSDDLYHGHHKHRLLHLVNNATAGEEVVVMIPSSTDAKRPRYFYHHVPAAEASAHLPLDIGVSSWGACDTPACAAARVDFGQASMEGDAGDPLRHRYVLLLDADAGPDPGFMRTLRSGSVPFVATVFRSWYTERLTAWVHYVPIDVRFHGLYSTLAYFVGFKGEGGRLPGQSVDMGEQFEDAKWIGREGANWAARALRREDMEVYLFRLLLEWGRVASDDRDKLAYKMEAS